MQGEVTHNFNVAATNPFCIQRQKYFLYVKIMPTRLLILNKKQFQLYNDGDSILLIGISRLLI